MKLFPTLPTDLGNRCGDYHISTAPTTTGMNLSRKTTPTRWGQFGRAKGARSNRQNQAVVYIIVAQCLCYGPLLIWQIWRFVKDTRRWKRVARQRIDDDFERRIAALERRMYH